MFSFFRKKPEETSQAKSRAPVAAKPAANPRPQETPLATPTMQPKTVALAPQPAFAPNPTTVSSPPPPQTETNTIGSAGAVETAEMYSAVEEAAILYASDHPDQAAALLLDFVKNNAERKEIKPWMMLFDIYQIQGKKALFEELALEFVVKFERSAPTWSDDKVPGAQTEKPKAGGGAAVEGYVALTGILQGDKDSLFLNLEQVAQKGAGLRLDFARLEGLDASGSRRLVETLQSLKKSGKKITPISVPHVTELLKALLGQGSEDEQAHWQLLLNLYQCQGMETEFEDLAVEYAITFEVSPPSWEAMPQCRQPVAVVMVDAPDELPHDEDTFFMSGVISADSAQQLQELKSFAASRSEVYLDMADVSRVDFVSIGDFVGVLVGLNCGGKKLRVRNANEMIRALFGVMGVDQFADILNRKVS
ncbi:MAG: STAS domain-containing protein [Gammaproteobacteria bacterium]|nr:STAS domain-containing protein [Gammaproteobacteria bacterium]MBU1977988.1 STAS domain-containing protein [Gammaproteobacteria bacterium]